jgi:ABC-2 type transport system ATP-binding protein
VAPLAVETDNLTKTFRGPPPDDGRNWLANLTDAARHLVRPLESKRVVDSVSLQVEEGEFFGIIGSNGAGKTTFLKLLACLLYPDEGDGRVNGFDLRRQRLEVRGAVALAKAGGWLGTLWQLNGLQNLLFRSQLCGLPAAEARRRADYVLERLELADKALDYSWNWSAGESQKFNLALTFVARTPIVILDEPTSHLDPRTARQIRDFVRDELNRGNGQTVIMSTHYLEEADQMCGRVAVLHQGKILACDTPRRLKAEHAPQRIVELRVRGYTADICRRVRQHCGLSELIDHFEDLATGQARLRPRFEGETSDPAGVESALRAEGVEVLGRDDVAPTLDDVYLELSREKLS